MSFKTVDINADVGEGLGNEALLMPYLSSCNIACGGHAGDAKTMTEVVRLAKNHKVKIGAHPSFPDPLNFGRTVMDISAADLYSSLKSQIRSLQQILHNENAQLHHIKPHGALYNLVAKDEKTARIIIEVVKSIAMPIQLYVPYNSVISKLAEQEKISVTFEAFADRNYEEDLSLVSRKKEDAILHENSRILNHILGMIHREKVTTINGVEVPIKAATFCVHGDTKNALEILEFLTKELPKYNVKIQ
ncbi:MAG: lactam utilization protein LamB [Flavobacteriaceae bacterium]|nr:lactam utilization protein LamB [Flavobacteriaceae bacterium]|tara:strand:- start:3541 stop:4281 length:741 start_codon:yes stop_codon:yes gene_type:complete